MMAEDQTAQAQSDDPILSALGGAQAPPPDPILEALGGAAPPKDPILEALGGAEPSPQQPAEATSFWGDIKQATAIGASEAAERTSEFATGVARKAAGGSFLPSGEELQTPSMPAPIISPETDAEVRHLSQQSFSEGMLNPRWYGVHFARGIVGSAPELAGGAIGALGGPGGAVAGFTGTTGALSFIPNYKAAKAKGLDDNSAIAQALIDSGIDSATALAMGLLPQAPFVSQAVRKMAGGPIREALIHMGVTLPAIGETGSQVRSVVDEGRLRGPDEMITDWVNNFGTNMLFGAAHAALGRVGAIARPATEEGTQQAYEFATRQRSQMPDLEMAAQALKPPHLDDMGFYSRVREVVDNGPNSASADQWRGIIQNAKGVKEEEVRWLRLPEYLADASGKVSREDLMNHIDENALRLEERVLSATAQPPKDVMNVLLRASPPIGGPTEEIGRQRYIDNLRAAHGADGWFDNYPLHNLTIAVTRGLITPSEQQLVHRWGAVRGGQDRAKYPAWTLPGQQRNYREVLLKMPLSGDQGEYLQKKKDYHTLLDRYAGDPSYVNNPDPNGGPFIHRRSGLEPFDLTNARQMMNDAMLRSRDRQAATFTAGHFDPNTLAHYRITDRKDRDGKRVRFIEEIQSDWHQKGRKVGYKGKPLDEEERDWLGRIDERLIDLHDSLDKVATTPHGRDLTWDEMLNLNALRHSYGLGVGVRSEVTNIREDMQVLRDRGLVTPEEAQRYVELTDRENSQFSDVPDAPFKKNWPELVFKRLLRQAADEGMERVAWTTGDQQIRRYGGDSDIGLDKEQQGGMHEFYDRMLPSVAKKYARQLGMEVGKTRLYDRRLEGGSLDYPERMQERDLARGLGPFGAESEKTYFDAFPEHQMVHYVELNEAAKSRVTMGFPLFSERAGVRLAERPPMFRRTATDAEAMKAAAALEGLRKAMKIDVPIQIHLKRGVLSPQHPYASGLMTRDQSGYHISVNADAHVRSEDILATLAHEFGHVLSMEFLNKAPWTDHQQLRTAYEKWRMENVRPGVKMLKLLASRDSAVSEYYKSKTRAITEGNDFQLGSLAPEQQRYWSGFEEWFAEQTARWVTTDAKPLTVVDRFFSGIAKRLEHIRSWLQEKTGRDYRPDQFVADWLNSFMDRGPPPFAAGSFSIGRLRSQQKSQMALDRDGSPEIRATEVTPVTMQSRAIVAGATKGSEPPEANADAAHADRLGKMHEWLLSLPQMADANPQITPLQYYRDGIGLFNTKVRQDHEAPLEILHDWQKLHGPQGDAVASLIDDWTNMRYLSEDEVKNGTRRMPSSDEFKKLVADNKVSNQGLSVFMKMAKHVDSKLDDVSRILKQRAGDISDPQKKAAYLKSIDDSVAEERRAPYFPFFHDGDYTVEVRGAVGETLYYGRARTKKDQAKLAAQLQKGVGPGEEVRTGFLAKDAKPLTGIPSRMLDAIADNLSLSESQKVALEKLKAEQKPQIAMIRRVRPKITTPGYSSDFYRSYAQYAFHTSRYFARVQWAPQFRGWIRATRELQGGTKIDQLANYMQKHFDYMMDPKPDFAALRGLIFNLRLGFSPTTATLYLTQTPLGTYPWLGHAFGDVKALGAIAKASAQRYNYYKSGKLLATTDAQLRAQREAMRNYVLDGGVAPELAGIAENANLSANTVRGSVARGWNSYQQAAGSLLHLADTWNRRIAFDATWHLAMENSNSPQIKSAIRAYPLEYARLQASGWTPQEAGAYVAGKQAVEATHFVYQKTHRPQVMWGKASALLMFQFWKQNMLYTLWNYPGVRMRSLMVMAAMSGLMGLPFAKDLQGLIQAVGWHLFGKDWNLEREIREYVLDHFGKEREQLADSLLHGLERTGMGIPTVLDLLGHHVGLPKLPEVDRSAAVGLGDVLPINLGQALGPSRDPTGQGFRAAQDVAGAAFGYPFDLYKFLTDTNSHWNNVKAYEGIIPHWMSNLSRAYRWYSEGMERDKQGNPVIRFDANQPTQMMEILARALGYTPTRLSQQYDARSAEMEVKAYWQLRREGLMRQAWDAKRTKDEDEFKRVVTAIQNFNSNLPDEQKPLVAIKGDQLREFMMNQAKKSAMIQQGLPASKKEIPLSEKIKKMYGLPTFDEQRMNVK